MTKSSKDNSLNSQTRSMPDAEMTLDEVVAAAIYDALQRASSPLANNPQCTPPISPEFVEATEDL